MDARLEQRGRETFAAMAGRAPEWIAHAPGRVNLIGEHTDYNDGFVLPLALQFGTLVAAARRSDGVVRARAADFDGATDAFSVTGPVAHAAAGEWAEYVRGMAEVMGQGGIALSGADLAIAGDLPRGAGLSSSASLEVAVGAALAAVAGQPIDPVTLARLAQRAESDFVGCRCGIMDQLVSAKAAPGAALLIDCRTLETREVAVSPDIGVLVVHSGVTRGLVEGAYNARRAQCEAAAAALGAPALRDIDADALARGAERLDDETFRRARHVVTENVRTLAAAEALAQGDLETLGRLMAQSHASMRDDFEISTPQIDGLVAMLQAEIGPEGGARMTGGGFGGAVVAVCAASRLATVRARIEARYRDPGGRPPLTLEARPSGGVRVSPC